MSINKPNPSDVLRDYMKFVERVWDWRTQRILLNEETAQVLEYLQDLAKRATEAPDMVAVVTIINKDGANIYVAAAEYKAFVMVYEYIKEMWHREFGDDNVPKDIYKAVEMYYNSCAKHAIGTYESYSIDIVEVQR